VNGIILCEGSNLAGKSFLIQKISELVPNTKRIHCIHRYKDNMFCYHLGALRHAIRLAQNHLVLIDRLWLSENIYGDVYRGGTLWPHEGRVLQKILNKHAVITVLCLANPDEAQARYLELRADRKEFDEVKNDEVARQYQRAWMQGEPTHSRVSYLDDIADLGGMIKRLDCLSYTIGCEGANIDRFIDLLLKAVGGWRKAQYQQALDFNTRNFAGHIANAKFMLVGDRVNHKDYKKCWPFSAYKNSSLFLARAMHNLNLDETEFVWTNAICEEKHIIPVLRLKPSLKVIALGCEASGELSKMKIEHKSIDHPAYSLRFENLEKYTRQLAAAIF
jgi:hypothetical protein